MPRARHTRGTFTTGQKSYWLLEILLTVSEGEGAKGAELLCNPAAPIGLDVSELCSGLLRTHGVSSGQLNTSQDPF